MNSSMASCIHQDITYRPYQREEEENRGQRAEEGGRRAGDRGWTTEDGGRKNYVLCFLRVLRHTLGMKYQTFAGRVLVRPFV